MNTQLYRGSGKPAEVQADLERRARPDVMLVCEGDLERHRFFRRQAVLPGLQYGRSWELLYQCLSCGNIRRWGLE